MPVLSKKLGGSVEIKKPNGRGVWQVHSLDCMRYPKSDKIEEHFDEETGERSFVHIGTHLTVINRAKQTYIPCTLECFQEAITNQYHRATHKKFFLYRKTAKRKKEGKEVREVGPVSLISVCENATYLRGCSPTSASQYAMSFLVSATDGSAIITGLHFAISPAQTESIASGLAAALKLKENDMVAGNPDLYIASITEAAEDGLFNVIVRSKKEDATEKQVQSASMLRN